MNFVHKWCFNKKSKLYPWLKKPINNGLERKRSLKFDERKNAEMQ